MFWISTKPWIILECSANRKNKSAERHQLINLIFNDHFLTMFSKLAFIIYFRYFNCICFNYKYVFKYDICIRKELKWKIDSSWKNGKLFIALSWIWIWRELASILSLIRWSSLSGKLLGWYTERLSIISRQILHNQYGVDNERLYSPWPRTCRTPWDHRTSETFSSQIGNYEWLILWYSRWIRTESSKLLLLF